MLSTPASTEYVAVDALGGLVLKGDLDVSLDALHVGLSLAFASCLLERVVCAVGEGDELDGWGLGSISFVISFERSAQ